MEYKSNLFKGTMEAAGRRGAGIPERESCPRGEVRVQTCFAWPFAVPLGLEAGLEAELEARAGGWDWS